MNYQRKPIMERYSYFMGCALRYIAGLILSRSKNYNYGTLKIFWPLYSKARQLQVTCVGARSVQQILTVIWYLLFGQGVMFIFSTLLTVWIFILWSIIKINLIPITKTTLEG